ncbi:hypothetical protein BE21_35955 [Sorangium cellulosum]|uniref:Uncharacterized protein n=1 Tax=Sorangium cellulosum TaxID=56 RepID=A0A150TNT1_SORCE|nr:hypothetical protein BE21_35955 [Sorangium cellulosum]
MEIFFLPPLAIARVGGSETPLECFTWATDQDIDGGNSTAIVPAVTLDVSADGSLRPYMPSVIRFRDGRALRPVAPFFELWATVSGEAGTEEVPLTLELLESQGASPADIHYTATAANRKAQRRTGKASCAFIAQMDVGGTDHARRDLLAYSPHNSGETPLVSRDRPIPLGHFQVIRPTRGEALGVKLSTLRVRFTPARGEVYGPPGAIAGPASPLPQGSALAPVTLGGRLHEIVRPENRILNPGTPWSSYVMDQPGQSDPQPSDSYDGVNVGDSRSWGVVDDTCDAVLQASLTLGGRRFLASARVLVGPPDFAPDRRPFVSLADDLADRDLPDAPIAEDLETEAEIADLFQRIYELASLSNLDANRNKAIETNDPSTIAPIYKEHPPFPDERTMTDADTNYSDERNYTGHQHYAKLAPATSDGALGEAASGGEPRPGPPAYPNDLSYTKRIVTAHAKLAYMESLIPFLQENRVRVRNLVRPPYGRLPELDPDPDPVSVPGWDQPPWDQPPRLRDPRVERDWLHDMRMPPYMRDSDETALSITRRQYSALMSFLDLFEEQMAGAKPDGSAPREEQAAGVEGERRRTRMSSALRRRVDRIYEIAKRGGTSSGGGAT